VNRQSAAPAVFALIVAAAASAVFYAQGRLHHDPSFILVATRRWLDGAVLYRDIIEINPPLIFYLTAPAVWLSNRLGVRDTVVFIWLVCGATAISLVWCSSLLDRVAVLSPARRAFIVAGCFLGLLVIPAYNFGQREHLFVILALPYFLAAVFEPMGLGVRPFERMALGFYAVCGIALKPFFLLPLMGVLAANVWLKRSTRPLFDPANLTIAAGCAAYLPLAFLLYPDYLRTVLPIGLKIYGAVAGNMEDAPWRLVYPPLLMAAIAALPGKEAPVRACLTVLVSMVLGAWVAFLVQHKIWDYLILPFDSMAVVASAVALALTWRQGRPRAVPSVILASVAAFLLASSLRDGRYENVYAEVLGAKLKELQARGKSILVLSTNLSAAFPLIDEAGARWVGSFPYQWMIAGALTRERQAGCAGSDPRCAGLESILDFARQKNVDDLVRGTPDIVLIDVRRAKSYVPGEGFDYLATLGRDARFENAWKPYRRIDTIFDYDVWVRDGTGTR
jgi:hypothetical protein